MITSKDYHIKPATADQTKNTQQAAARRVLLEHNRQKQQRKTGRER